MFLRSELSLQKDEFNFTWILAHEVKALLNSEDVALTPNLRLELVCIYLKLLESEVVDSATIAELSALLGIEHTTLLERQTAIKARLETDFANSDRQKHKS